MSEGFTSTRLEEEREIIEPDSVPCKGKDCERRVFEPFIHLCVKCKDESLKKSNEKSWEFTRTRFGGRR